MILLLLLKRKRCMSIPAELIISMINLKTIIIDIVGWFPWFDSVKILGWLSICNIHIKVRVEISSNNTNYHVILDTI